jgi:hypothetical protein
MTAITMATNKQAGLTVVTRIKPQKADHLCNLLERIGADIAQNDLIPFKKLSTVHFARLAILPEVEGEAGEVVYPAQLVLSTSYDGSLDEHLRQLLDEAGPGLNQIFCCCEGFPELSQRTRENVSAYFRAHSFPAGVLYIGAPGLSVTQTRQEAELHDAIENFLDEEGAQNDNWAGISGTEIRAAIQQFVRQEPQLEWARVAPPTTPDPLPWPAWIALGGAALLFAPAVAAWFMTVRLHELYDEAVVAAYEQAAAAGPQPVTNAETRVNSERSQVAVEVAAGLLDKASDILDFVSTGAINAQRARLERIGRKKPSDPCDNVGNGVVADVDQAELPTEEEASNEPVQNYLSHVSVIKPGRFRLLTLTAVLKSMNFGGARVYNQGNLFGVRTLHFVRWVIIDEGRRLLFITNYDGSLPAYIADFRLKSPLIPMALTALWSNTIGFPQSSWLVFDGFADIRGSTDFLVKYAVPTQVWYSAYERLTTGNIVNNARIRKDLFTYLSEEETLAWLRRL